MRVEEKDEVRAGKEEIEMQFFILYSHDSNQCTLLINQSTEDMLDV